MTPPKKTSELGWFVDEERQGETLAFGDAAGASCRLRAGRDSVSLGLKGEAPIRLSREQARHLAAALQRWVIRQSFAA